MTNGFIFIGSRRLQFVCRIAALFMSSTVLSSASTAKGTSYSTALSVSSADGTSDDQTGGRVKDGLTPPLKSSGLESDELLRKSTQSPQSLSTFYTLSLLRMSPLQTEKP